MISEKDKKEIVKLAKKYNVKRIILFGSGSKSSGKNKDIDLAVEGVPPKLFFKFYSELIFNLSQPVDLVDMNRRNKFITLITSEGVQLYGDT